MTILMLVAFHFFIHLRCTNQDGSRIRFGETGSARTPLLENKDDDILCWGSSYDSVSQDAVDAEEGQAAGSLEGTSARDGEYNNNIRRLCAICFDAPRDCFFLPCGHCVACFACGTSSLLFYLHFSITFTIGVLFPKCLSIKCQWYRSTNLSTKL